jgi:FKBP-type peptidyl-prolyl cis-trans isomerase 2
MSGKKALIMAVLLVAVIALMAGCAGQSKTAKTGDNVSVDYALWVGDNTSIIETSNATLAKAVGIYDEVNDAYGGYAPITFVIGDEQFLTAFENATIGMKVGETKNITLQPADAYGDYNPAYIEPINMSDLIQAGITPYVNATLTTQFGQRVRVDSIKVNETDYNSSLVYIDYNSPLASKVVHFMITLRSVETSSPTPKPTV